MSSSVNPCVGKLVWIGLATVAPVWAIWPWNTCKLRKGFKSASSWSITSPPCNHIVPILQWECNEKTWSKEWTWFCSLLAMSSCQRSALTLGGGDVSVTRQIVLWFLTTSLKVPLPQCDCYLAVAQLDSPEDSSFATQDWATVPMPWTRSLSLALGLKFLSKAQVARQCTRHCSQ